ncbi:MAG: sulfatase-like hydrolase/transferase, partial [Verrucomicrobiota bacterium]
MSVLLRFALLAVALPALAGSAVAEKPALRPNILFLFGDDQRFDTIHALGNRQIQTPNLDRLVRDGFSFTHTFCMGSLVPAVCVPSRAMMLTGRSLFRATTQPASGEIPPTAPTWPEVLRQAGYSTVGIGKWHNDRAAYARSFTGGGPVFFGGMTDHTKMAVHHFDPTGVYAKTNQWTATTFSSELFAEAAIQFLRVSAAEKPFLLYVAFTAPHDPRMPPKEYAERYRAAEISL